MILPVALIVAQRLGVSRGARTGDRVFGARSAYADVLMVVLTLPWIVMILTPRPGNPRGYDLVPFRDLAYQFHVGILYAFVQITGNLLVFAALGAGLPVRWRIQQAAVLLIAAAASAVLETLQWVLDLGRFTSIDDVIVNAAGAFVASLLSYPWWRSHPRRPVSDGDDRIGAAGPGAGRLR